MSPGPEKFPKDRDYFVDFLVSTNRKLTLCASRPTYQDPMDAAETQGLPLRRYPLRPTQGWGRFRAANSKTAWTCPLVTSNCSVTLPTVMPRIGTRQIAIR